MDNQKKISAAIAAVMHYIQEEAILMQQAAMGGMPQAPTVSAAVTSFSPWSMNGRQTQMQMRNLMQMRTFQRESRF
ncbi:MAG: hypothetical protein GY850_02525 [bacterium]|nr:hypothetical protein [bacterium]